MGVKPPPPVASHHGFVCGPATHASERPPEKRLLEGVHLWTVGAGTEVPRVAVVDPSQLVGRRACGGGAGARVLGLAPSGHLAVAASDWQESGAVRYPLRGPSMRIHAATSIPSPAGDVGDQVVSAGHQRILLVKVRRLFILIMCCPFQRLWVLLIVSVMHAGPP